MAEHTKRARPASSPRARKRRQSLHRALAWICTTAVLRKWSASPGLFLFREGKIKLAGPICFLPPPPSPPLACPISHISSLLPRVRRGAHVPRALYRAAKISPHRVPVYVFAYTCLPGVILFSKTLSPWSIVFLPPPLFFLPLLFLLILLSSVLGPTSWLMHTWDINMRKTGAGIPRLSNDITANKETNEKRERDESHFWDFFGQDVRKCMVGSIKELFPAYFSVWYLSTCTATFHGFISSGAWLNAVLKTSD